MLNCSSTLMLCKTNLWGTTCTVEVARTEQQRRRGAHLKNLSFHVHLDDIWLAPHYDLRCTASYHNQDIRRRARDLESGP